MKHVSSLVFFLLLFSTAKSQTGTFRVEETDNNTTVNNNAVFYHTTTPMFLASQVFKIINTSNATQTINLKKTDFLVHKVGAGDSAAAQFCVDFYCFGPSTYTYSFPLKPGEEMLLHLQLKESSLVTESVIKYRLSNAANASDVVNMTLRYNDENAPVVSIAEHSAAHLKLSVYPNPVSQGSAIHVYSAFEGQAALRVTNALGAVVASGQLSLKSGDNSLPLASESLSPGIYYISLSGSNAKASGKFIVAQ